MAAITDKLELHVYRTGQTTPFPFAGYSTKDLADPARRSRLFDFYSERRGVFSCELIDTEEGTHYPLEQLVAIPQAQQV